jgi:tRNA G18 (ribose-2'-O)-methylase SpoU
MPRIPIDTLDDPRVAVYRDLTKTNLTRWSGVFIAEGHRVVRRLIESDFEIESMLIGDHREASVSDWLPEHVDTYVMPRALAQDLLGYNFHAGVLACGRRKPSPLIADMKFGSATNATIVVLPNVHDPENLGAIIRISAAFGASALLLGPGCADPFSRRVLRVSMGTALSLPIVESADLRRDLAHLRESAGFELAAAVLDDDSQSLATARRQGNLALLLGNEAHGLDAEWIALCDRKLTIPMQGGTDSLNVAVATAVFLFQLTKPDPS